MSQIVLGNKKMQRFYYDLCNFLALIFNQFDVIMNQDDDNNKKLTTYFIENITFIYLN